MDGAKPYSSLVINGSKLSILDGDPLPDPSEYRNAIGALQYLTWTRPDIAFTTAPTSSLRYCLYILSAADTWLGLSLHPEIVAQLLLLSLVNKCYRFFITLLKLVFSVSYIDAATASKLRYDPSKFNLRWLCRI
ncbi:hypothetical protein MRB53_020671 [Persea americana]|uniref:Uncharacterized protein n=1 Tax=Persea americana TaxID=3435 RepID=A0ACC2L1P4_PERAE|nr:hypothetical protein MRB53_020671 [Persea americana]